MTNVIRNFEIEWKIIIAQKMFEIFNEKNWNEIGTHKLKIKLFLSHSLKVLAFDKEMKRNNQELFLFKSARKQLLTLAKVF